MKKNLNFRRPKRCGGILATLAASVLAGNLAQAHISYTGRDFGSYTGLSFGSFSINNQTVRGNYGWADAADGILGDSHSGRAFRFHLDNTATISLSVSANPTATGTSLGGLNPAFSIYSGLAGLSPFNPPSQTTNAVSADHDTSVASEAWRTWWVQQNLNPLATDSSPTDGSWNALGDWKIGGDGDLPGDFSQLSSFIYKGSAAATGGANTISGSFLLDAGDYTIFIGGNDLANKTSGTALSAHGIAATLSVTPVPEPSALALVGLGAFALSRVARRRTN
jgi:PEP-CTERM motif